MPKRSQAEPDEIDDDHPGPGYELVDDHDAWWKVYYNKAEGIYTYVMPEEDAAAINAAAEAEGVSVEVYIRRKFGLPDEPPPAHASDKTRLPRNDNREQLYREMAHVKFFAAAWKVSPAEVIQTAADALDDQYSWEDIQYQIAVLSQQSETLLRRVMAGKQPPPGAVAHFFAMHAWTLLLMGEIARRSGSIDAIRDIAAGAKLFQKNLDALEGKTGTVTET